MRRLKRRAGQVGAVAVMLGLAGVAGSSFAISWYPSQRTFRLQGPDVAAAQGSIDWPKLRLQGASFGYAVATIGADGKDARFAEHWQALYAAGVQRGAIHVYSLCRLAIDQANNFNRVVPATDDSLPPAILIDFQPDCATRPDRAVVIGELNRLLAIIEARQRKSALLKVSRRFDAAYQVTSAIRRDVWSVQNFFPPDYAARPWKLWQATTMRRIDGATTLLHWNVMAP